MILVSACLLGHKVKYSGGANPHELLMRYNERGRFIAICPECFAMLPVPRPPMEIQGGNGKKVLQGKATVQDAEGRELTSYMLTGADKALKIAEAYHARVAILKEGSPSCGVHRVHDGSFTGKYTKHPGVTAALLMKHGLNRTGLKEYLADHAVSDPEEYLAVYNRFPRIEQFVKAGLTGMVKESMRSTYDCEQVIYNKQAGSLKKALGLNGPQFKRLRENNGTLDFLRWLQFEALTKAEIPDKVIRWMCEHKVEPPDIEFIIGRMNVVQVYN